MNEMNILEEPKYMVLFEPVISECNSFVFFEVNEFRK